MNGWLVWLSEEFKKIASSGETLVLPTLVTVALAR